MLLSDIIRMMEKEAFKMAIKFKNGKEVMKRLKDVGYSSTRLRKEGILGEAYMTQIRVW